MFSKNLIIASLSLFLMQNVAFAENKALQELKELEAKKDENHSNYMAYLFKPDSNPEVNNNIHHYNQLPDGTTVDFNNYAFVIFMMQHCPYSAKFDPKLKDISEKTGLQVFSYTLDGGGDKSFPHPMIPTKVDSREALAGEIMTFFGNGLPIATPTTFLVNVNTNQAYPLYQGDTDENEIMTRVASVIMVDIGHMSADQLGPVPTGNTTKGAQ